mmetsp:Transcript_28010/g.66227  ORF Transcript_28010/g.66227 Transcript_28010/m.66227 type:complete len:253 (-) Transcript_28010:1986-2744(-)
MLLPRRTHLIVRGRATSVRLAISTQPATHPSAVACRGRSPPPGVRLARAATSMGGAFATWWIPTPARTHRPPPPRLTASLCVSMPTVGLCARSGRTRKSTVCTPQSRKMSLHMETRRQTHQALIISRCPPSTRGPCPRRKLRCASLPPAWTSKAFSSTLHAPRPAAGWSGGLSPPAQPSEAMELSTPSSSLRPTSQPSTRRATSRMTLTTPTWSGHSRPQIIPAPLRPSRPVPPAPAAAPTRSAHAASPTQP